MVEERLDGLELFEAIREAMTAVRQEREQRDGAVSGLEALREAHMRSCLRKAKKEGFSRIAVVCGACMCLRWKRRWPPGTTTRF